MTVLVTGATGLVGSRILKRLVAAGFTCRALVRAGKHVAFDVETVEGDMLDPTSLGEAMKGVSAVVHLAAVFRTADENLIWQANLEGTRHLIGAAHAHAPGARFIMASTTNIYPDDQAYPGREDDHVEPTLAYPASKLAAEKLPRSSGLNWSIHRLGFVYGDGDEHMDALPAYARKLGWHPAQRMSLIHHRDVALAMQLALAGNMDGQVVNIVDDAPASLYDMAMLARGALDPSAEPLVHPWRLIVDGSRARGLGFRPTVHSVSQAAQEGIL